MESFVHLHNHSEYSLLDGANRITDEKGKPGEWLKTVAEMKMPAIALTDHGNLHGAVEFYQAATQLGIKPILGCEMYLAPKSRFDKTATRGQEDAYYHFTMLSQTTEGYQNLMTLSTQAYLEGYYYKPRVDKELLAKYNKGLIALSGCLKGELAEALLGGHDKKAAAIVDEYQQIFGKENYFLEFMDHGIPDQKRQNDKLLELAKRMDVPLVITNDCHYLKKEDASAHDVLLCIGTGSTLEQPNRMRFHGPHFYCKSPEEMWAQYKDLPDALRNTLRIAERCNVEMRFDQMLLPEYEVPEGHTPDSYVEHLCQEGLKMRYGSDAPKYQERLAYELSVIRKMGFSTYFLIVWDFVGYAKRNGVPVGPGRGSGAGSLVAYALKITDICPVKYGLLFERFLNPDRRTMPDLDIDFSDGGREKVIQYVRQKYGDTSVAQIITFGSMLARLVIRDVGRVMGLPILEVDRIAKLIPKELGTTIKMARQNVVELDQEAKKNTVIKELLDSAEKLEGMKRHTGVHAAGIVIAKGALTKYVPLARGAKEVTTTQYNDESLLKLGLLKMDFLGLRTLTVIDNACQLIRGRHDPQFDLNKAPLDDPKTFKLLQDAKAIGIFQLESSGMRDLLRKLHPSVFEEIIALIALYRPGPMGAGMLEEFVKRKHNPAAIKFDHPLLEPILKETYGIILYQEQVMQIAVAMGGFTPGQADGLRKAMGKKIPEELEKQRGAFMKGAADKKIPEKVAHQVFEQIVYFGGYGFNKSHSTAYGLVSYQTAYLKANYPLEYMTALMTSEIGHSAVGKEEDSKLVNYLNEAEAMGLTILPPDIQASFKTFTIEDQKIRFGLLAIKNVGDGAVDVMVSARGNEKFESLEDFAERVDLRQANRKVLESLIKAGAMDSLSKDPAPRSRARALEQIDEMISQSTKMREQEDAGQTSLFGSDIMATTSKSKAKGSAVSTVLDWSEHVLLAFEKEVLGFYLSGHPLARYEKELHLFSTHRLNKMPSSNTSVRIAGMIGSVKRLLTKAKKEPYARGRFEDLEGEIDLVIFPKAYAAGVSQLLKPGNMVILTGRVSRMGEEGQAEILVEEMTPLDQAREKYVNEMLIRLPAQSAGASSHEALKEIFKKFPGRCRVCIEIPSVGKKAVVETPFSIQPVTDFFDAVERLLGSGSWEITRVGDSRLRSQAFQAPTASANDDSDDAEVISTEPHEAVF